MSSGHIDTKELYGDDGFIIFLLGTNSRCKSLVGNKILEFDHFQPEQSTHEEISFEIGDKWVTVIYIQDSQKQSITIQRYTETSSRQPCINAFVLQRDQVSQSDLDTFTLLKEKFGKKFEENLVVVLVSSKNDKSAQPKNGSDENLGSILYQYKRKVCYFNKNSKQSDLIKKITKCWKSVPEMPVPKHERSHMDTVEEWEIIPQALIQERIKEVQAAGRTEKKNNMTVVLLGQTGSGKSATGNTILKRQHFDSYASSLPVTQKCQMAKETVFGINISVIDTPDFFDEDMKNQKEHIKKCKDLAQPGPDVYLLVMELGRFTDGEREILHNIQRVFGESVLRETIILFTGKEKLRGKTLSEYIKNTNTQLQELIRTCGSRCHAINNNDRNDAQVKRLLEMILNMMWQNGNTDIEQYYLYKESQKKDCRIQ
ncbi:GTPase IMAP family member 8-like [Xyrauchen texanus]|uniref:GTPase IMAP family member 8-like n=1 Tax=Xyrauchen texanus TaxID=154827 RepID=UPI00224186E1|nr:GTPase IMAP family member 8-like [Xyrauchen texanus]